MNTNGNEISNERGSKNDNLTSIAVMMNQVTRRIPLYISGNDKDNPHKLNCNMVIQMMCEPKREQTNTEFGEMRDGTNTQRNDYQAPGNTESYGNFKNRQSV